MWWKFFEHVFKKLISYSSRGTLRADGKWPPLIDVSFLATKPLKTDIDVILGQWIQLCWFKCIHSSRQINFFEFNVCSSDRNHSKTVFVCEIIIIIGRISLFYQYLYLYIIIRRWLQSSSTWMVLWLNKWSLLSISAFKAWFI